jgi:hypothetical protein
MKEIAAKTPGHNEMALCLCVPAAKNKKEELR